MSGRGGLLCPRLMTGMFGGRVEDDDEGKVVVGGGTGHGGVLAGAGRSGGGEETFGDPLAEAFGAAMHVDPWLSSSSFVSMTISTGAPAVFAC